MLPGSAATTPGPSRFSSSYGSPLVLPSARNYSSGNAVSTIGNVFQSVQASNREDLSTHATRVTAHARTRGGDGADDVISDDDDQGVQAMPPPPRPGPSKLNVEAHMAKMASPLLLWTYMTDGGDNSNSKF